MLILKKTTGHVGLNPAIHSNVELCQLGKWSAVCSVRGVFKWTKAGRIS